LADEEETLRQWLVRVRAVGWPLVVVAFVCPVAAGSAAVTGALASSGWPVVAILSFVGAAAVAIHRGLQCESYQEGLSRTIQSVRSIGEDFEAVVGVPDAEVAAGFKAAEARLRDLRASGSDMAPKRRRRFQDLFCAAPSNAA
jgi:hypothetical protein